MSICKVAQNSLEYPSDPPKLDSTLGNSLLLLNKKCFLEMCLNPVYTQKSEMYVFSA